MILFWSCAFDVRGRCLNAVSYVDHAEELIPSGVWDEENESQTRRNKRFLPTKREILRIIRNTPYLQKEGKPQKAGVEGYILQRPYLEFAGLGSDLWLSRQES